MAPEPERLRSDPVAFPRGREEGDDRVELWGSEPEVLGHDGPHWTPPRWALAALAVVVVIGGVAWFADHRLRVDEDRALVGCQAHLQAATSLSDQRLNAMYDYLRPTLSMNGGQRARQRQLMALMERPARRVLPSVERADRACRAVQVRGWHLTAVARRRAATAYSGALVTWIRVVAGDGRAYFGTDAALRRLRTAAGVT